MIIKNKTQGYGYKYTDLAQINETLEELGLSYEQETRTEINGEDYIWTRIIDKDGKAGEWRRGAMVVRATLGNGKSNPAQEYGSSLTYARRYSLYMVLGIATDDDDASGLENTKRVAPPKQMETIPNGSEIEVSKKKVEKAIIDKAGEEKITKVQDMQIMDLLAKANLSDKLKSILNETYKVENMSELTKKQADSFISRLNATIESKKG